MRPHPVPEIITSPMNDPRSQDDTEDPRRPADAPADEPGDDAAAAESAPAGDVEQAAEGPAADDTAAAGEEPGAGPAATPPADRRGGRLLGLLGLLVALAAAGAAGWLGWRVHELEQRLARVPEERRAALAEYARASAVADLESGVTDLEGRIAAVAREQESVAAEVRERIEGVEEAFASLRELAGRDQVGWRMAEVRFLVTVAARRLVLARDVEAAVAALEGADDALASLGDARLLPLRERIVGDLEALRAVEPADVEGTALRLRSLEARVAGLPVQPPAAAAPADDDAAEPGATDSWWQRVKHRLAQFVVVRREPAPEPARAQAAAAADALSPHEALRLALADATRAALARDPTRYHEAMDEAIGVVRERFAADAPATAAFRDRLETLRARPVRTEVPDLTPTLELAERLSARLQRAAEAARTDAPGDAGDGED